MNAFFLTWKIGTELTTYEDIRKMIADLHANGFVDRLWYVYASKQAQAGDRAYLLRQGKRPNSVFGLGHLLDNPCPRDLPDGGRSDPQCLVRFEALIDPETETFLIEEQKIYEAFAECGESAENYIKFRKSGGRMLPDGVMSFLDEAWENSKQSYGRERQLR